MKMLVWVACINKKQTNREKEQTKFALFCLQKKKNKKVKQKNVRKCCEINSLIYKGIKRWEKKK